jgi:hypothetical protein
VTALQAERERHFEVRVGNVETADGGRQVFAAVTRAETDITALCQRTLEALKTDMRAYVFARLGLPTLTGR